MYVVVTQMTARRTRVCCYSDDCKEDLCMLLLYG